MYFNKGITASTKPVVLLRWPWFEWKESNKIWVETGNTCTDEDIELFYAATTIVLGNGCKTSFWHAPWLDGLKPKDIAPKHFRSLL
jgi:hypothetical protein